MIKIIDFPYVYSKPVDSYDQIKDQAEELKKFVINKKNFTGRFKKMFAIHASQVSNKPFNFFVLHPKLVLGEDDQIWKHRVIINPEVVWADPEDKANIRNLEGCASYSTPPFSLIVVPRCLHIKVKYQIPKLDDSLETIEEEMFNLKAVIFAHETDHGLGRTIYFPFREPKEQV